MAGRWSAKEAFTKALGTGVGRVGFQDIEILTDEKGAPLRQQAPLSQGLGQHQSFWSLVQASVILEEEDES
ncbi:4'-phosphopantetheinyl transferase superfamily protein [Streptococcus sp.]|uniref:4'-phosphopantetheinyl transferase superfamily protein n=1 Tax=Streptococcus sp. TaxID=1306 RepID=UPI003918EEC0